MRRAIVWFKTNLRLNDNECLQKALADNDEIISVYCFDDAQFEKTKFGFHKTGSFRANFLLESLANLEEQLKALGSSLLIVKGLPETEIYNIAEEFKVQKVYAEQEFAFEEIETEKRVKNALNKINCYFHTFNTRNLIDHPDLPFDVSQTPDVFTTYRKLIEESLCIRPLIPKPLSIKSPPFKSNIWPTLAKLNLELVKEDHRAAIKFVGGATEGNKRMYNYFYTTHALANYKETRNGMVGSDYSTKFSAWLSLGCLSPREIYHELKNYESQFGANASTYWVFFELLWRDYFGLVFKKYGKLFFLKSGIKSEVTNLSKHNDNTLNLWINGKTGNNFIDANMLELKFTGFMSNRGRQNVASNLCNELKLDWRYGASYFEQQLIDYDVCSNWGNWAYLAGVGNDPRKNRYFNLQKQALTYDTNFLYRNLWLQKN